MIELFSDLCTSSGYIRCGLLTLHNIRDFAMDKAVHFRAMSITLVICWLKYKNVTALFITC